MHEPEGTLRDLLLHKLSAERTDELADRIVQEGQLADRLEAETTDLLDDYARGLLNPGDARLVEEHLLTARDAPRRLAFAQALADFGRSEDYRRPAPASRAFFPTRRPAILATTLSAGLVLLVVGVVSWRFDQTPPSTSVRPGPASAVPDAAPASRSASPGSASDSGPAYTVVLLASQVRGGEARTFVVPSGAREVRIQCEIPAADDAIQYRMVLNDAAGRHLDSGEDLRPIRAAEILYVEASYSTAGLKQGRYTVTLSPAGRISTAVAYDFLLQFGQR